VEAVQARRREEAAREALDDRDPRLDAGRFGIDIFVEIPPPLLVEMGFF
jgi:hypothetical protein